MPLVKNETGHTFSFRQARNKNFRFMIEDLRFKNRKSKIVNRNFMPITKIYL